MMHEPQLSFRQLSNLSSLGDLFVGLSLTMTAALPDFSGQRFCDRMMRSLFLSEPHAYVGDQI
jgi:hypothetical protein